MTRIAVLAAVASVAMLVVAVATAGALVRNNTFGSAGSGAGQFSTPLGVAVDQSNGSIYVADGNQARVEKFSATGTFQRAWGWGVADGNPQFETCTATCQSGQFGNGDGQFGTPASVAVDSTTHDVYVGDSTFQRVEKFSAAGAFLSTIDGSTSTEGPFQGLSGIAVDQSGNLWTDDRITGNIDEFDNTGAFAQQWNDNYGTTSSAPIGVDSTNNAVYLLSPQDNVDKWSLTGTGRTTLTSSFAVQTMTVDPTTGSLYVADAGGGTNQFEVFDTTGTQTDSFPATGITLFGGAAVRGSTAQLSVSDQTNNDVGQFVPAVAGPPVVDGESASNITRDSATLNAQVNPFGNDTTCTFQYVDDATFQATAWAAATTVACSPADLGTSFTDQAATADIAGLSHGTTYHFRVVATNGTDTTDGPDRTFATLSDPSIDSESATNVTDTTATLKAQINPNGGDATYQFQFGTDTSYSGGTVPATAVDLGSGTSDAAASADLTGLTPNTTYHFRVVVNGTVNGADQTFHTFATSASTGLPDGRGLEMVTPADKDNGEIYVRGSQIFGAPQAATNGNAINFLSFNGFPGSVFDGSFYLSNRAASNWTTANLIPPQSTEAGLLCATAGPQMMAYNGDLSQAIYANGASLIGTCGVNDPPLVPNEPKGAQNLFVRDNASGTYKLVNVTPAGVTPATATYDATSADYSHVVFDEAAQLTADSPGGGQDNLYDFSGGTVKYVTVVAGSPVAGTLAGGAAGSVTNAVSSDGSRIYFQANGNLYLRSGGTSTVQVDASKAGGPGGGGTFAAATSDGGTVYFTDDAGAGLTADTVAGSGLNLYEYDVSSGTLTDLTPTATANVDGVTQLSGDGSYLYFVANGVLPGTSGATDSQPNLYVRHGATMTFIATLSGSDNCDWSSGCMSARESSSGAFLAFNSAANLTSYNSNGDTEIYLYDAAAAKLSCASCNPSGVAPVASAVINAPETPLFGANAQYLQRNVSDAGQVFFVSLDQLLPTATNGHQNVYEYAQGKLSLLSSGTSVDDSLFIDASPSGNDVFFTTSQQLLPQDTDGAMDVYDARVGGGFPFTAPPPACTGENCKPLPTATPPVPPAASVTFSGPGNVKSSHKKSKHHKKGKKKHKKGKKKSKHSARVTVISRNVTGGALAIRVTVPAKGQISAWGNGLRRISQTVHKAGTVTLTWRVRSALTHKGKRKVTISVRYVPAGGSASTATVNLTVGA